MVKRKLRVAEEAVAEIQSLAGREKESVIAFLERLAANPYSPDLIEGAIATGDLFAFNVVDDLFLYWALGAPNAVFSPTQPFGVHVVGLVRRNSARPSIRLASSRDEHQSLKHA